MVWYDSLMVLWKTSKVASVKGVTAQTVRRAIERGELKATECLTTSPSGQDYISEYVVEPDNAIAWTPRPQGRPPVR